MQLAVMGQPSASNNLILDNEGVIQFLAGNLSAANNRAFRRLTADLQPCATGRNSNYLPALKVHCI